ncbi:MAG: hypothetical protein QOC69_2634, partial [Mycobacterium sp.]|nr:hypothetical protein [Mycobacterium sp.]
RVAPVVVLDVVDPVGSVFVDPHPEHPASATTATTIAHRVRSVASGNVISFAAHDSFARGVSTDHRTAQAVRSRSRHQAILSLPVTVYRLMSSGSGAGGIGATGK